MAATELYRKFRPQSLDEVVGQDAAVACVRGWLEDNEVPQAVLFHGPSGCGKTTLARILRMELKCDDADFTELNAADTRGIDTIRSIKDGAKYSGLCGPNKVYIIDECHALTKDAQTAMLKMIEDPKDGVYFFLASTEPDKLLKTIRTRCTHVALNSMEPSSLEELIKDTCKRLKVKLDEDVRDKLVEVSGGSARQCMVLLGQIRKHDTDTQMELLEKSNDKAQAINLCRELFARKASWPSVRDVVKNIDGEPENIRRAVLGYASSIALSSKGDMLERAILVMESFQDNYFDTGKAGLILSAYNASAH